MLFISVQPPLFIFWGVTCLSEATSYTIRRKLPFPRGHQINGNGCGEQACRSGGRSAKEKSLGHLEGWLKLFWWIPNDEKAVWIEAFKRMELR